MAKHDRNAIQVHYLPARRDPADHISYSANALLGRALRSANWAKEREEISNLTEQIGSSLAENEASIARNGNETEIFAPCPT